MILRRPGARPVEPKQAQAISAPPVTDSETNARFHLLYELGCAFAARLELAELVPMVVAETRRALDASGVSVLLHDAERRELYFPYVAQDDAQAARRLLALRMPSDRGIAGTVVRTEKPSASTTLAPIHASIPRSTARPAPRPARCSAPRCARGAACSE